MNDLSRRQELLEQISELLTQMPDHMIQQLIISWETELKEYVKDGSYDSPCQDKRFDLLVSDLQ